MAMSTNNVTATDPTVDPATGKPKITTTPAVASPTVAQPIAPVPAGNATGATTTATAPMAQPITPSVQPVPYTNPVPTMATAGITPPPIADGPGTFTQPTQGPMAGVTPPPIADGPGTFTQTPQGLTTAPATSGGAFSYNDPSSGLTLKPGTGAMAGKLTFTDPASGKTYYSMGAGGGWEEVGTNAEYTGKAPDIGATLNATGNITSTPGGAYDQFTQFLTQPGNTNIKDAQAAQAAMPQVPSAYKPGDVATLQNGVATLNGKVTGLTNPSGGIVDPATGQLSNAGGIVAAQGSNATAGVPGSVNGTPIVDYLTSLGLGPGSGSVISGGNGTPSTSSGSAAPVSGATATGTSTATGTPSNTVGSGQSTPVNTGNATLDQLLSGASNGGGVNQTPTTPGNSLLDQTLSVGNLADPVQQALAAWKTFQGATDPQFQADQRDAIRSAAAGGALGSGQLNTSLGDIANQRQNTLQTAQQSLLENALNTQNSNAYANEGIAAQQQGFQSSQQQNAVNNALAELLAGSSGNPADTELALSGIFGNNASQASSALSGLISGTQNKNAASSTSSSLSDLLKQLLGNAGASQVPSGNSDVLNALLKGGTPSVSTGVSG